MALTSVDVKELADLDVTFLQIIQDVRATAYGASKALYTGGLMGCMGVLAHGNGRVGMLIQSNGFLGPLIEINQNVSQG